MANAHLESLQYVEKSGLKKIIKKEKEKEKRRLKAKRRWDRYPLGNRRKGERREREQKRKKESEKERSIVKSVEVS